MPTRQAWFSFTRDDLKSIYIVAANEEGEEGGYL
jgi:hypothetical protein